MDEKRGFGGLGSAPLLPFQLLNSVKVTVARDGFLTFLSFRQMSLHFKIVLIRSKKAIDWLRFNLNRVIVLV
jgi:hypothetical protein